jgi:hypothetical protein
MGAGGHNRAEARRVDQLLTLWLGASDCATGRVSSELIDPSRIANVGFLMLGQSEFNARRSDRQATLKIIVTTFGLAWRIALRTVRPSPVPGMWRSLNNTP